MKKIFIASLAIVALAATSCNQSLLDIDQKGVTAIDNFYQTDDDCEQALAAAYAGFGTNVASRGAAYIYTPFRAAFNNCGDDFYAAGSNFGDNDYMAALNEFRYDSGCEVIGNMYSGFYLSLYTINLVIDNFKDGLPEGGQTAVTKRCVAEARVLRAYIHMMLAIGWDCPPFVDHVLSGSDLPYNCDKDPENPMTHEELLQWCAEECLAALPDLNERAGTSDKDGAVKVTKGFANAVAGKAYIFAGKYSEAKSCLKAVIDSQKYALVPGDQYTDLFHIEGDANAEKVFEANIEYNAGLGSWSGINQRSTWMEANIWSWRSDHFAKSPNSVYTGGADGWGGCGVPYDFASDFLSNDGPDSYRFNSTLIHIDDVVYGKPEIGLTYGDSAIDDLSLEQKKASTDIGISDVKDGLYGQSFYLPLKQVVKATDCNANYGNNVRLNNFTIMRYAEVLLLYAEACVQSGSAADALPYINAIQQRAGSQTISSAVTMDVVKKEKKYELWLESCRWADLVRWGDTDGVKAAGQNVPKLFDKLFRAPASGETPIWENGSEANSRFYMVYTHEAKDRGDQIGFVAGKHEHFPYPTTVIAKNPNLVQNPGWE